MRSKTNQDESIPLVEEDSQISRRTLWFLLTGVFLISFSLLTFEITLTRLTAAGVLTWMIFWMCKQVVNIRGSNLLPFLFTTPREGLFPVSIAHFGKSYRNYIIQANAYY